MLLPLDYGRNRRVRFLLYESANANSTFDYNAALTRGLLLAAFLLDLDFDINARWQVQLRQCVNRSGA